MSPGQTRTTRIVGLSRVAVVALVGAAMVLLGTPTADAAARFSQVSLSAKVAGQTVVLTTTVKAKKTTKVADYGICVRNASERNLDPSLQKKVSITKSGRSITRTKKFAPGRYKYYPCLRVGTTWYVAGKHKFFTVKTPVNPAKPLPGNPAPTKPDQTKPVLAKPEPTKPAPAKPAPTTAVPAKPTPTTAVPAKPAPTTAAPTKPAVVRTEPVNPGAQAVTEPNIETLPKGDLGPWKQVYAEDFSTSVPRFAYSKSAYPKTLHAYKGPDTSGRGTYDADRVLSVSDGKLIWDIHTAEGTPRVSGVVPMNPNSGWGQQYGRFSFRFKADKVPGYKMVGILWPDSDNWGEGEVDFPEVNELISSEKMYANVFTPGDRARGVAGPDKRFTSDMAMAGTGWHTATIEWSPNNLTYILDGKTLGTFTTGVPTTKFHLVLQVETELFKTKPDAGASGRIEVDWVTVYEYKP